MISNGSDRYNPVDDARSEARGSAARARSGGSPRSRRRSAFPIRTSASRLAGRARQGAARRGRSLQGRLRLPVHRSRHGQRHHVRPPRRGRRGASYYKPVHYDHGNGIAVGRRRRRRPDRTSISSTRSAATSSGRTSAAAGSGTSRRTRASRSPTGSASPPPSRTSTTTATRISSSPRSAKATCCSRTTATAISRTSRRPPASTTSATRRARCSSTTTTTACSISTVQRRPIHQQRPAGPDGAFVGLADAFSRPPASRPRRRRRSSTGTWAATGSRTSRGGRPRRRRLERRCQRRGSERRRLSRSLRAQHAGVEPLLREPGRQAVRRQDARSSSRGRPWGAMGIKFFDYDNDGRPDLFITDMHSDMSVEVGPDREKLKSRMEWTEGLPAGRRDRSTSSATRSSTISGTAGSRRFPTALGVGELLAVGPEHRRPERRRLAGHLHRLVDELPVALRDQLAAAEQSRREVPRQRVPARHRAAARRPHAHPMVRRRLLGAQHGRPAGLQGTDRARSR